MKGIDVSTFQGKIDFEQLQKNIDFMIIRAGFGSNNIDEYASRNIAECAARGIPFGVYWFSYCCTEGDAYNEGIYCANVVKDYKVPYPCFWDFEGESVRYATKHGVTVTKDFVRNCYKAFLDGLAEKGFYGGVYCNVSYYRNYFDGYLYGHPLWLAQWEVNTPSYGCEIWQKANNSRIPGISGNVDENVGYTQFEEFFKEKGYNNYKGCKNITVSLISNVISGKYGNGETRKTKLKAEGYNPDEVQEIVNKYYNCALKVIRGEYGNGENRKTILKQLGYDPGIVQNIVNAII